MITLYQFRHSAFCLKTRMALHAKKLQYRVDEVTPGLGQFEIFKLSGQKQVPVIVDSNDQIINDSSTICEYIDKKMITIHFFLRIQYYSHNANLLKIGQIPQWLQLVEKL